MKKQYDIAAYVWPAYTGDEPRTRMFWREGIGEWQSVKNSAPKENGYFWNRKPLWGYQNEADPEVMKFQINEATKHGVNVFIYDWYWFDNRPFLENCLNDGFLKAENCQDMKFYLMWANHDVNNCWNIDLSDDCPEPIIWKGTATRDVFENVVNRVIEKFFKQPNYYKINGCPVFAVYDVANLVDGLGGIEKTKEALAWFREQTKAAGFPDLNLQIIIWGENNINLSGFDANMQGSTKDIVHILGADSVTHYQFAHYINMNDDYLNILEKVKREWERIKEDYKVPYFPHISCGWDNNPRFRKFRDYVTTNNTPENLEKGLRMAKEYVDTHPEQPPLVTINAWNEWTETSYLLPDDLYGYGYLEAVKRVFVDEE